MNSYEKIYEVVKQIPKGYVATYGQVARLAGNARWARVVGYALHVNPDGDEIPCYRVVTKDGMPSESFAFGGKNRQVELLEADGVEFKDGKVIMEKYKWKNTNGILPGCINKSSFKKAINNHAINCNRMHKML